MGSYGNQLEFLGGLISSVGKGPDNFTFVECEEEFGHYTFYQTALIPAVLVIIAFSFTKKRRQLFLEWLKGRPGIVSPMDMMTRDTSMSYAAAFAGTLHLITLVIFERKTAFSQVGQPTQMKSVIVVGSMLVYGMVFFPVFACLALGSTFGYFVGSLYVWYFTAATLFQTFQCSSYYTPETNALIAGRNLPEVLCLMYLCVSIPGRFVQAVRMKKNKNIFESVSDEYTEETLENIKASYIGRHVRKLLIRPKPKPKPPEDKVGKIKATLWRLWNNWVYKRDDGFEYSSRFQSVMFVGALLLYILCFESLSTGLRLLVYTINEVETYLDYLIEQELATYEELELFYIGAYFLGAFRVSYIVADCMTLVLNLINILHMMSSYRRNLRALHRGDYTNIPPACKRSNSSLLLGSIRYAGYQVGYIAWGFVIQGVIIFLICMALATIIILITSGYYQWLLNLLLYAWPVLLSAVLINIMQILVTKFIFLQERGKFLAFENRRVLFGFTYFMFFYNIFLGLVSCLFRIIKSILLGALLLPRLDHSTLPQAFQFLDPGFSAYVGFMHIENSHNHPVVLVLVRILLASRRRRVESFLGNKIAAIHNVESKGTIPTTQEEAKKIAARFNWHVFYTLINNPDLRLYRKGYLQAVRKAREEGLILPVSDTFTTDFTIPDKTDCTKITKDQLSTDNLSSENSTTAL